MKLLDREDIQTRIKDLRKPLELQAKTQALTEREKKRAVLWEIINTGDNNDKCRAMDILNKMDAEYVNVNVNKNDPSTDLTKLDTSVLKTLSE